jgi:thymidine phosphorylase
MNQVLGRNASNVLEVREAIDFLTPSEPRNPRLHEVVLSLGAQLLLLGTLVENVETAREKLLQALESGAVAERFARMIAALGGPVDLVDHPDRHLPRAPFVKAALPTRAGFVASMDTRALGIAVVGLGGGRYHASDSIDYAVGLSNICQVGERVDSSRPLALVHALSEDQANALMISIKKNC